MLARHGIALLQQLPLVGAHRRAGQRGKDRRQRIGHRQEGAAAVLRRGDGFVDVHHRQPFGAAQFVDLAAMRARILQRAHCGFGDIVDIDRLQRGIGREHRQHRKPGDQPGEHVDEVVVLAEDDARPHDGRLREGGAHALFAQPLGFGIGVLGVFLGRGGDRADMDEGGGAVCGGGLGHPAGRFAHQAAQVAAEGPDQIDHRIGAGNAAFDRCPVGGIAARELELPEIRQRLEREGLFGVAGGDPHARPARQQRLRHVIADEAATAHQHHQSAVQRAAFRHDFRLYPQGGIVAVPLAATLAPPQAFPRVRKALTACPVPR